MAAESEGAEKERMLQRGEIWLSSEEGRVDCIRSQGYKEQMEVGWSSLQGARTF